MSARFLYTIPILVILFISCEEENDSIGDQLVGKQLLFNSDMELGDNKPKWWNQEQEGEIAFDWAMNESFSSSRSLRIARAPTDPTGWGFWKQSYYSEIPYGKDLQLSVKIKGKDLKGEGVAIVIYANDGKRINAHEQFASTEGMDIVGTFDWTPYTVKLNDIPADTHTIHVYLIYLPRTTGEVYFDDATLVVE